MRTSSIPYSDLSSIDYFFFSDCLVPVFDVLRMALLREKANVYFLSTEHLGQQTLPVLEERLAECQSDQSSNQNQALQIVLCRSLANAAAHPHGRQLLIGQLRSVLPLSLVSLRCPKAAAQLAASAVAANLALALQETRGSVENRNDFVKIVIDSVRSVDFGQIEMEAVFYLLQCLVTVMWGEGAVITVARSLGIGRVVSRMKDVYSEEKGKIVARAIDRMLNS